ncbi:uncharacterized protein LOC117717673 [Arvicanthis niloticus]|uniref:uncharacterized protein LOC117717673 n=1 Tax=Arvicanthis niloticus TaxID=61156 RepID=UPI001486D166|nr:uncharacterized protein LOC117717673 [Arvicanthis niloticus]
MANKFSWAHLSDANLLSASSETCTDLSDANLPTAFSETCTDLSDANLPTAFSETCTNLSDANLPSVFTETGWSISSLVNTMCSLSHMAEENLDRARTTHFRDTLAKNDVLFKKKSDYHPGQIVHLRKRHSIKSPACRIILPPFPLKRRWSELALPTFMMTSKNGNSVQQDGCVNVVNTNATDTEATDLFAKSSKGIKKEAEIEETGITISFSLTPLDVLSFLEDTASKRNPGCSILELPSTKHHLQEAPSASNRNSRRLWKWVRRQISHPFRRLFLCFSTRSRRHTTSRTDHWAQARGS